MQNKGFVQFLVVLVALASLWSLSHTFVSRKVENDAKSYANGDAAKERLYLDSIGDQQVFGKYTYFTYNDSKRRELNLGLDLKGGMNVTLEVSVPKLLKALANNTEDANFNKALENAKAEAKTSNQNFVDIFYAKLKELDPKVVLASPAYFGHKDQTSITNKTSNDEVVAILKKEAEESIERSFEVLNSRIDQFGVTQPNIQRLQGKDRILVELPGVTDPERVRSLLAATAKLEFWETYEMRSLLDEFEKADQEVLRFKNGAATASTAAVSDTTLKDSTATADVTAVSADKIQMPGDSGAQAASPAPGDSDAIAKQQFDEYKKNNPMLSLVQFNIGLNPETQQQEYIPGPILGMILTKDTAEFNGYMRDPRIKSFFPADLRLMYSPKPILGGGGAYLTIYTTKETRKGKSLMDGDVVTDASFEKNPNGSGFMVTMQMNREGAEKWSRITEEKAAKKPQEAVAIVLDGKVYSAPTINQKIPNGSSQITGNFSFEDAKTLATVLKAGKLPAPTEIIEEAVVGPSLGEQAINAGLLSVVIALVVVLIYMAFYYGKAGLVADAALVSNILFLMGTLASLSTTLTLPGIAGIVLTFGMSVDANVLIFERIREELREGKGLRMAISEGYSKAYSSIIDGNVTTILTALILMIFGAGPVKGFAVTLFIGILTSLFSAIFISRLIFEWMLNAKKDIPFSIKATANAFTNFKFDFVGKRKMFYVISGVIILAGFVSFFTRGFNLGVDLQGGRTFTVTMDNAEFKTDDMAKAIAVQFEGMEPQVKLFGGNNKVKIVSKYKYDITDLQGEEDVKHRLYEGLKPFYKQDPGFEKFKDENSGIGLSAAEKVGPSIAGDTRQQSVYAVIASLAIMFVYIMFRFQGWRFGFGATLALAHDVLITLAMFSLLDGFVPFSLEVDQAIIAAVLTVIGYSINDTVVVFDRIREYLAENRRGPFRELINAALNSTISRTINTSFTTLIVLVVTFLFGGPAIKGMSFALLVGIGVGTYSSLCIASPIMIDLGAEKSRKKEEEKAAVKA
ncbi:MAG: protein translocase subunit SecDF [Bacteroidia bacterium]|nr:protein translocase subunit SecDF [Bacteroidia bacterium]